MVGAGRRLRRASVVMPPPHQRLDDPDDEPVSPGDAATFDSILRLRLSRRETLKALGAGAAMLGLFSDQAVAARGANEGAVSSLIFSEVPRGRDDRLHVPAGYRAQVVLRWGQPMFPGAPAFDPHRQSAQSQQLQIGYNNDFVGYLPLPRGTADSDHGLLAVNHEYTLGSLMFPETTHRLLRPVPQVATEMMAHGMSIVELRRTASGWRLITDSAFNRRITPLTRMRLSGPAAGHPRMKTRYSPDGAVTWGTYANCSGDVTPWGTVVTAEENIQFYYSGLGDGLPEEENYRRFGMHGGLLTMPWGRHFQRWNLALNPNEPLHAGWIVEVDPFDPTSTPVKRTALGRCKHEGCCVHVNADGRVVCYLGDDQEYEYVYRFVTRDRFHPDRRAENLQLLDDGILSVAEFDATGTVTWHPLVFGRGPLTQRNRFHSQADVVIDLRKAADLVGATRMDRPESVVVNPVTGSVFVVLTANRRRMNAEVDAANPRPHNTFGHILELVPPDGDHSALKFKWEVFLLAGNPGQPEQGAGYHPQVSSNGWLMCPDNCDFDAEGRMWIATDGANLHGLADGVWATDVAGPGRALTRHFLRAPIGAEVCGPCFTPDNTTFFCAIQHPGEGSTYAHPTTRWPDFRADQPPRPAVVAVTREDGGVIGS